MFGRKKPPAEAASLEPPAPAGKQARGPGKVVRLLRMLDTVPAADLQCEYKAGVTYRIKKTKTAGPNSDELKIRALADEWVAEGKAEWLTDWK